MNQPLIPLLEASFTDPADFVDVKPMTPEEIEAMDREEAERAKANAAYTRYPSGLANILKAFNSPACTDTERAMFIQMLVKNDTSFLNIQRIAKDLGKSV